MFPSIAAFGHARYHLRTMMKVLRSLPRWSVVAGLGVFAIGGSACSSTSSGGPAAGACSDIAVDRFKEIEIVDEAVVSDPRSLNASAGAWSFRHVIEELTPAGMTPSAFVTKWLQSWNAQTSINTFAVPGRMKVGPVLTCPWLRRTPANACNDDCSTCSAHELDLASAPFRLIGLANRIDLRETEGVGEARLIYALTDGAADDAASPALAMTAIFEFDVVETDIKAWAEKWHSLGKHEAFDESYRAELAQIYAGLVTRGSAPARPFGSALSQVRTNERVFDWQWDFRQFELGATGLVQGGTTNTPDRSLNGTPALKNWVLSNKTSVMEDKHKLPESLTGGSVSPSPWQVPGVDESLRSAFAKQTCDGCHQIEAKSIDINFQVSPFKKGIDKLAPFLNDVASPKTDELTSREASMQRALCGQ
ncbi:MAG: hypothetical protein ABIP89_06025 [Polyangiaceae bacterium]